MSLFSSPPRWVQVGHITTTLRKRHQPIPQWLQHVDHAPARCTTRREKENFLREQLAEKEGIAAIFGTEGAAALSMPHVQNPKAHANKESVSKALKLYRILQGDTDVAPPFYKQDALLAMRSKMNQTVEKVMDETITDGKEREESMEIKSTSFSDPFEYHLPVVNPRAFSIALESAVQSLADDLESLCVGVLEMDPSTLPVRDHPERFLQLVRTLFGSFPLRKDPSHVGQFMIDSWPKLKKFFPVEIPDAEFQQWLTGHLERVIANQSVSPLKRIHAKREWYSIADDFAFDTAVMGSGGKNNNSSSYGAMLGTLLRPFTSEEQTPIVQSVSAQLDQLVRDLKKIGLSEWLMDPSKNNVWTKAGIEPMEHIGSIDELFDKYLPRGPLPRLEYPTADKEQFLKDQETAKLLLKCAARGKVSILELDAVNPSRMMHSFPSNSIEEELSLYAENPWLKDADIDQLFNVEQASTILASRKNVDEFTGSVTPLESLISSEKSFAEFAGPAEWKNGDWQWKVPSEATFDSRVGKYVRHQSLVDPNLNLSSFRQFTVDVRRMCSMSTAGRVYYARSIVVVGNGQGIYGFGVGFGNTPRESNADAAVKALRNLKYVDFDPTRSLPFPVRGSEYKARLFLRPLRQGKKLKCGRRFLPLFYILGLHNVRARFNHTGWFSRITAVQRTLDQIQSRRTLANSTGQKYADIIAPGDHWVHWPDKWFDVIRRSYQSNERRIKAERKQLLHHKNRGHVVAHAGELKPGWTKYAWMNPLAKWNKEMGRTRTIARSIKQLPPQANLETLPVPDSTSQITE